MRLFKYISDSSWHLLGKRKKIHNVNFRFINLRLTQHLQPIICFLKPRFVFLKPILVYIPPLERILRTNLFYPIERQIYSTINEVIFTRSKRTHRKICLKMWQPWKDELYDTLDVDKCTEYLLEGLAFNRRHAPGVYLGIAPVEEDHQDKIQRGQLIINPEKGKLESGVHYALVMICLNEKRRLDYQLDHGMFNTPANIDFLARKIASMHKDLDLSPLHFGVPSRILAKLDLNISLFTKALGELTDKVEKYEEIENVLKVAYKKYESLFEQRCMSGYIKRCHGDLKATNLWLCPVIPAFSPWKRLLALDCIDFRPEFCHIDTLSDVAMLAIDIEMRLMNWQVGQNLSQRFLNIYLQEAREKPEEVWPLVEYYMAEKSMVYVSISTLYDKRLDLGEKYLQVALTHAHTLEKLIGSSPQASFTI